MIVFRARAQLQSWIPKVIEKSGKTQAAFQRAVRKDRVVFQERPCHCLRSLPRIASRSCQRLIAVEDPILG